MGYINWANKKIKEELDYWDIKLMKTMAFLIGLPVGAYFSEWTLQNWWKIILLALITKLRPWYHAFRKHPEEEKHR